MRWFYRLFRVNFWEGRKSAKDILSQLGNDRAGTPKDDPVIPAYLITIKNAYENAMVEALDGYVSGISPDQFRLNKTATQGAENIQLMQTGLFDHLRKRLAALRNPIRNTLIFVVLMVLLVFLDFAPTKLVFDSILQHEPIVPMLCSVPEASAAAGALAADAENCLIDRDVISMIAILGFLAAVVMMGHFCAAQVGGEYFDGSRSALGWAMIIITVLSILVLTIARVNHEIGVVEQKYATHLRDMKEQTVESRLQKSAETAVLERSLSIASSEEGKSAWMQQYYLRVAGNAGIFTVLSLLVFLAAFFLSLWHKYIDFDHYRRQRTLIYTRLLAEKIRSGMEIRYNRLRHELEEYQQSAQREMGEFFQGAEKGARKLGLEPAQLDKLHACFRRIQEKFNSVLKMPEGLDKPEFSVFPRGELDWGETYKTFLEHLVFYDAFEKGGLDAINVREPNPGSILTRVSLSINDAEEVHKKSLPEISRANTITHYEAGYKEGQGVLKLFDEIEQKKAQKKAKKHTENKPEIGGSV